MEIIIPAVTLGVLGMLIGMALAAVSKKFAVQEDSSAGQIYKMLPGSNCGACGFSQCLLYAKSIVDGKAKPGMCAMAQEGVAEHIAKIIGSKTVVKQGLVARVFCNGDLSEKRQKGVYYGIKNCLSASLISGGQVECYYGCLGFGDCVKACPYGAIIPRKNMPPEIIESKCAGCGLCVDECPKKLIKLIPKEKRFYIQCSSCDKGSVVRSVCDTGCTACGLCVEKCPNNAISIKDRLAVIDYNKCKGAGACFKVCPTHAVKWER